MKKLIVVFLILISNINVGAEELPKDVPAYLQDISVTISAGRSEGSGVVFSRETNTFIWTAGHVVDSLRRTRNVIDPNTGTNRTIVEFNDAKVIKRLVEDGKTVGRMEFDAEVIKYSNSNNGEDLALLRVRKRNFVQRSAIFYKDEQIPQIGVQLFHVGSLLGQMGSNSMTAGIMSQHGRLLNKKPFDQTTVTAFPGSSGGGVYLTDGRYIGMLVRGAGEGFNLIVPVRRMRSWAKRAKIQWAMDAEVPVPSEEDFENISIEDIGVTFKTKK